MTREKGELLRRGIYTKKELEKKRSEPMYHWLQQQGVDNQSIETISARHIGVSPSSLPIGPRVISIDASLKDGPESSYNVAQVWQVANDTFHLIDQFRVKLHSLNSKVPCENLSKNIAHPSC